MELPLADDYLTKKQIICICVPYSNLNITSIENFVDGVNLADIWGFLDNEDIL